jgi:hypothetical protein
MALGCLAEIDREHGVLWRFDTARYTVAFWAEPEDMDPAGDVAHWFCAFVGVFRGASDDTAECVGYDILGGCDYNSYEEFYSAHREGPPAARNCLETRARGVSVCHYFPDMVRVAIKEARNYGAI